MMEEDKNWFTKQVTMFNEDAFQLGHCYHLWHTRDDGTIEHYNGLLQSKGENELWFKASRTGGILPSHHQCDIKDVRIRYSQIDEWDFAHLVISYKDKDYGIRNDDGPLG